MGAAGVVGPDSGPGAVALALADSRDNGLGGCVGVMVVGLDALTERRLEAVEACLPAAACSDQANGAKDAPCREEGCCLSARRGGEAYLVCHRFSGLACRCRWKRWLCSYCTFLWQAPARLSSLALGGGAQR